MVLALILSMHSYIIYLKKQDTIKNKTGETTE